MKLLFHLIAFFFLIPILSGQGTHNLSGKLDGPLLGSGAITFGLGYHLQKKVPLLTKDDILKVDPLLINPLDRLATKQFSLRAKKASDILLKTSGLATLALLLDDNSRDEFGVVGVMLIETTLLNNGITGIFKGSIRRTRPYVYNADCPLLLKQKQNARYSFFSGHASNSAAYSFFAAKVFSDNNPNSKLKPYVWGTAISIPAATGFLRFKAGKHFPTDVIVGYAVGAAIGWLVPELHR